MSRLVDAAFVALHRELPGRFLALRQHLQTASPEAQQDFARLVRAVEEELDRSRRKAHGPWRG